MTDYRECPITGQTCIMASCQRGCAAMRDKPGGTCGWLIETARQTYWDGRSIADPYFTYKVLDAVRFARFEDAEIVRCWLLEPPTKPQTLRSVEHIFGLATLTAGRLGTQ